MPDTSSPHLAASPSTEKTPYFGFIDGLRCLAVTCVLLFHILGSTLPGGYVGVDVFFVISGFLITGLCLREKFSYGVFLAGRARRILPAYFAVLLVSGLAAFAILLPEDLADAHKALLASPVFLQNFVFWKQVNYFSPALERNPFLHTWSLAVEWQFYLVFPLLLRPLRNTRWLIPALVAMSLLTLAASTYGAIAKPTPTFYLTPFRVWEFLVGGFVALWLPRIAVSNASAWALGLGVAALLLSSLCFSNATPFPGAAALVPCLGTAALLVCGLKYPDHPAIRLLTLGPVRLIGQASYSIYLVHWPLLVFVRYFEIASEPVWVSLALIAASCALGLLSWRWVERPFRIAARGTARRNWGLVTACAIAAVGATAVMTHGMRGRFPVQVLRAEAHSHDSGAFRACLSNEPPVHLGASGCRLGRREGTPQLLLWGDSYAAALAPGIDEQAKIAQLAGQYIGTDSCPPLQGYPGLFRSAAQRCRSIQAAVPRLLVEAHPRTLVLFATWRHYYQRAPEQFEKTVRDSFAQYAGLADRVVVVGAIPQAQRDMPDALARKLAFHLLGPLEASDEAINVTRAANAIVRDAARAQGFTYIDLMTDFCDTTCQLLLDDIPIYFDSNHITSTTARRLAAIHRDALLGSPSR